MDLELDLGTVRENKRAGAVHAAVRRPLTEADVEGLLKADNIDLSKGRGIGLMKIRDTHHAIARLDACGTRPETISAITGYAPQTIYQMRADPAYKELLSYYRDSEDEAVKTAQATLYERLTSLSMVAAEVALERVTTDPDSYTNTQIAELIKLAADRTGFGPTSRQTNVNVNVNVADRLQRARARANLGPGIAGVIPGPGGAEVLELRPNHKEEVK